MSKSQRVCQYWQSTEKSNASVALVTVSRFFRALPITAGYLALQQKILADLRINNNKLIKSIMWFVRPSYLIKYAPAMTDFKNFIKCKKN